MTQITFDRATLMDIQLMLDWAADEGWNPGVEDAAAFQAADPGGFFVAKENTTPVAAISVVNHCDDFAFLGLYLCKPSSRGKGIGLGLWTHALAHAEGRTVGLDGVPEQEANYAKSGFVLADRTRRLTGAVPDVDPKFTLATPEDFAALARLDQSANGYSRPGFLREWLRNGPTRKTVVLRENTGVTGFATLRRCRADCKIGPIVAANAADATKLLRQAAAALDCTTVSVDVPDSSAAFGALLKATGFTEGFATARMYRGRSPVGDGSLQAVASLELG